MKPAIIVTGVGKGFGRCLLLELSSSYAVIGVSRSKDDIETLKRELAEKNINAFLIEEDVRNLDAYWHQIENILEANNLRLHGLINNAGVRCRQSFVDISADVLNEVMSINFSVPYLLSQKAIVEMLKYEAGSIINISSILSSAALPDLSAYSCSKGALDALTRSLAVEYGSKGIRVNSIQPGFCETSYFDNFKKNSELYEMTLKNTPAGRWGNDAELIGVCELLLSDKGAYINGACVPVDGGWLAK